MKAKSAVHGARAAAGQGGPQKQQLTAAVRKPQSRPAHMRQTLCAIVALGELYMDNPCAKCNVKNKIGLVRCDCFASIVYWWKRNNSTQHAKPKRVAQCLSSHGSKASSRAAGC